MQAVVLSPLSGRSSLEVRLLAAGLEMAGEEEQRQNLLSNALSYGWNCYFPNSGSHEIMFVVSHVSEEGSRRIGAFTHTVKVVKLDHLTKRQVWALATTASVFACALGAAQALRALGVW